MNQAERRIFLINYLLNERGENATIPAGETPQKNLLRALENVRPPMPISSEFLKIQDEYFSNEQTKSEIIDCDKLQYQGGIALYQGDITRIKCDAIVNAANSAMLGCFCPLHGCIDNAIHSAAGVQLRLECNAIMQGREANNGDVIMTKAYNLPSQYIFHTLGPIVNGGSVSAQNENDLKKCYTNCLKLAQKENLKSIAFCCISTGVFGYPKAQAAKTAIGAVKEWLQETKSTIRVIFNVFTEEDYGIYKRILGVD